MQPHNPLLTTFRTLSARAVQTTDAALPKPSFIVDPMEKQTPLKAARTTFKPVPGLLDQIDAVLTNLGDGVFQVQTNADLTSEAKNRQIANLASTTRTTIDGLKTEVLNATHKIVNDLRSAAYPSRPQPVDATQEAALAGVKADVRMVLDGADDPEDVVNRMVTSLERAIGDGDQLTQWLLASSRWPEDYIAARNLQPVWVRAYAERVAQVLDAASPANLADARRAYRQVSNPQTGLPVLDVLFANTISEVVNTLAEFRLSSF